MPSPLRSHPRLAAAGAVGAVMVALLVGAAVRSTGSAGCSVAPPVPQLPAALRALGDFDQPYDAREPRTLQDAALKAASALHGDLGGQALVVGRPVIVAPSAGAGQDALVIPLGTNVPPGGGAPRNVEALVSFLRDCNDHAYYSDVVDLAAAPPAGFPSVSAAEAASRLGVGDPGRLRLVYTSNPFTPLWEDPASRRTVDAQPPAPSIIPSPQPIVTPAAA